MSALSVLDSFVASEVINYLSLAADALEEDRRVLAYSWLRDARDALTEEAWDVSVVNLRHDLAETGALLYTEPVELGEVLAAVRSLLSELSEETLTGSLS